jgi:phosphate-selective porin OprO and OprP
MIASSSHATEFTVNRRGVRVARDNAFIALRGYGQWDYRAFMDDDQQRGSDDVLARRIRPTVQARMGSWNARFTPDVASDNMRVFDAILGYDVDERSSIQLGKFKPPVSLERLQSATDLHHIERGHPSSLAPNRDFGVMFTHRDPEYRAEYQFAVMNGTQDLGNAEDFETGSYDVNARIFAHPWEGNNLGIGIAATLGEREGTHAQPLVGRYVTPAQQTFFRYQSGVVADGLHWRLYPHAYWYDGEYGMLGEYAYSNQEVQRGVRTESMQHQAWQMTATMMLTGEEREFAGRVQPLSAIDPRIGAYGIGAWELSARIGATLMDADAFTGFANPQRSARSAQSYGVGVSWYWNDQVKWMINYDITHLGEAPRANSTWENEQILISRVQLNF